MRDKLEELGAIRQTFKEEAAAHSKTYVNDDDSDGEDGEDDGGDDDGNDDCDGDGSNL